MNREQLLQKAVDKSRIFLKRNGTTVLTCVGAVGVVATAVTAAKATPKALLLLEEAEQEKGSELTKLETVKVAGPAYIPSVLIGASTIACIVGANMLNQRKQAALMSAYALLDQSYREYKDKVDEMLGKDGAAEIREAIAKDHYEEEDEDWDLDDGKQLFYDEFAKRYFESTIEDVRLAEYELNRAIHMRGWYTLSELYEQLDVEPIDNGYLGWSEGGNMSRYWQGWVDFHHHKTVMDDGLECIIWTMFSEPYIDWDGYA